MSTVTPIDTAALAARLRLGVTRLARRLRQEAEAGITPSMLSALSSAERRGPLTMRDLCAAEQVQPSGPGHGVRVDSHAYSGYQIPPYYDSMIGKLICFGSTRKVALERSYRALSEYLIRGIKTTIPLHKAIMADPVFIEGKATTAYMEDFMNRTPSDLFV